MGFLGKVGDFFLQVFPWQFRPGVHVPPSFTVVSRRGLPRVFGCQQMGEFGGDEVLSDSRSGAKWALSGGVPPPKPPGYFRNHSLKLPLGWDVSLVGVCFGPERERLPGFPKGKKF